VTLFEFEPQRSGGVHSVRQVITYRQPSAEEYALYLGPEDI
jgi:hypothetical protein